MAKKLTFIPAVNLLLLENYNNSLENAVEGRENIGPCNQSLN